MSNAVSLCQITMLDHMVQHSNICNLTAEHYTVLFHLTGSLGELLPDPLPVARKQNWYEQSPFFVSTTIHKMKTDCYILRKLRVKEINRFRLNWAIICGMTYFHGVIGYISTPSLYQFITSSSNTSGTQVVPGLGLSEMWYSCSVGALSVGVFFGALFHTALARSFYYKYIIIGSLFITISSGVLYGFAIHGWMVLAGRFLSGVFIGISQSLTRTYGGESSEKVIQMRKEASLKSTDHNNKSKSSLKYTNFFILFATSVIGLASGPALGALASQIPSLDPFRWPGYYIIIHGVLLNVFVMLFFCEKWDDVNRKVKSTSGRKSKIKFQKPDQSVKVALVFVFAYLVIGWVTAIMETLENPILSGNFGLTIKYQSYIFIATLAMFTLSNITIYIFQRLHADNRFLLVGGFVIGFIGTVLVGDWQSIRGDPCNTVSSDLQCSSMEFGSGMVNETFDCIVLGDQHDYQFCNFLDNSTFTECCNSTSTLTAGCICESLSNIPEYNCYWNPNSIITGEYCQRCRPVCLGRSHTLSFIQFVIGVCTLSGSIGFNRILITIVVSDLIGKSKQGSGWLIGLMMGASGLSQSTGPLWTDPLYLLVGNRTWLVSAILASLQFIVIILFIIFFKQFKAKKEVSIVIEETANGEDRRELLKFEEIENEADEDKSENTIL